MSDKLKVFAVIVLVLAAVAIFGLSSYRSLQHSSQTSTDKQAEYEKMVQQRQQSQRGHLSPYAARATTAAATTAAAATATGAPSAGQ